MNLKYFCAIIKIGERMKRDINKMTKEEIRAYYEKRAYIMGALFAFLLLLIAFLGFFFGFRGPDLFK